MSNIAVSYQKTSLCDPETENYLLSGLETKIHFLVCPTCIHILTQHVLLKIDQFKWKVFAQLVPSPSIWQTIMEDKCKDII